MGVSYPQNRKLFETMKGNYKETMSLKALACKVLTGNQAGNQGETSLKKEETFEETSGQKFPNSVTRIEQKNCVGCKYHDTGPTPDGKGTICWCGPWRHKNGDLHYFNIEEWLVCPLDVKKQMQRESIGGVKLAA